MSREWQLTNGIGGYASSSVVGCNTRRYHAVLCAATLPPVGRILALSRIAESLFLDGDMSRRLELSVNQFRDAVHPRGDRYLRSFSLWRTAEWQYDVEGVAVRRELLLCWNRNLVGVRYTVDARQSRRLRLELAPFTPLRDFHGSRHRDGVEFAVTVGGADKLARVTVEDPAEAAVAMLCDAGAFEEAPDWWYGHVFPIEADRGLDDSEDLFTPGRFVIEGDGKLQITLWAATAHVELPDWEAEKALLATARGDWLLPGGQVTTKTARRLVRAADDFVVTRRQPDGSDGATIIAGYPWFADWGRDTFISLPGLMLATGRFQQACQVLTTFGQFVDRGMIPNRFDDYTNEPHYNTVDASLWYIHAAFEYARLSGDNETFERALRPACRKIIEGYRDGTRYGIHADTDGLITQGDLSTQLTWMDARCGDTSFTPRQGKPVEINALWHHALMLMGETDLAAKSAESFRNAFWVSAFRGLADVVNDDGQDRSIRPNQIFAVSLPHSPLTDDQQKAVVEVVRRELLTPVGLRTLARSEPGYHCLYTGPQYARDEAYHNGTIWPWPLGAFLSAYLKVHRHSEASKDQCRAWLQPLIDHMEENCLGQIAEIFEAAEPHRPVGCHSQAWSVAEVLRLVVELDI